MTSGGPMCTAPNHVEKAASDRRRVPRTPVDSAGDVFLCPSAERETPIHVAVRDTSGTGVGLISAEPISPGQEIVISQAALPQDKGLVFTAIRSKPLADG